MSRGATGGLPTLGKPDPGGPGASRRSAEILCKTPVALPDAFGPATMFWTASRGRVVVRRILLPGAPCPAALRGAVESSGPAIDRLAAGLIARLSGGKPDGTRVAADLGGGGEFQRRVLRAVRAIPRGQVRAYRDIARCAGSPNAVRAVGRALATNPLPLLIPCHRVVRSDGALGGYQGGPAMKRFLLEREGFLLQGPQGPIPAHRARGLSRGPIRYASRDG